jgi:DNA-binding IclR family transcriptional regulator
VPRPSPQTERVTAILDLLTDRPDGATSTEISRTLGINPSTCVHVLSALTSSGHLVREDDRRYHLGPALVRSGQVAATRYADLAAAREEMRTLARRLGRPCFAFAPDGDHARLVLHAWPGPDRPTIRVGDAIPLTPPLGAIFAAWADDDAVEHWLSLDPALTDAATAQLREQLAAIRRDGHVIETGGKRSDRPSTRDPDLPRVTDERPSPWRDRQLLQMLLDQGPADHVLTEVDPDGDHVVDAVGAPVRDGDGRVTMSLTVVFFDPEGSPAIVRGTDLVDAAREVRAAAHRVSERIGR